MLRFFSRMLQPRSKAQSLGVEPLEERAVPATTHFAVIGDFGADSTPENDVATLVKSWAPDYVVTVGDNNYPDGAASTIVANIGKYYGDFIYNPDAPVGERTNNS